MQEQKSEFVKRKKSEKRAQAERQVKKAHAQLKEIPVENKEGMGVDYIQRLEIDGKYYPWRIRMKPEIEDLYSTIDISKALKIPRERLRDWMVKGFITPSLPSTSKGTIAIFIRTDVLCVALLNKLINRGFKREMASEYVNILISAHPAPIGTIKFLSLKTSIKDGEPKFDTVPHFGDAPFQLSIDSSGNFMAGPFGSMGVDEWEDIHVINMIKLRQEVDKALADLD